MDCDVAIIGGGPAGCATALELLSRRCSVSVIAALGRKDRPTETAAPALAQLLRSLGAEKALEACEPCYGILSAWGRRPPVFKPAIANPHGHAWFIHRARFDAGLQNAVRERGGTWIADKAQSLVVDAEGASISTKTKSVRARWAVLATGSPASAARLTGQKVSQLDLMVAFWALLPAPFVQRLLLVEPAEQGWWYVCPADGHGAVACFITDPLTTQNLRPDEPARWNYHFRATNIYHRLGNEQSASSVHVALTGLAALPQTSGNRWIAVGDAAAKLDPLGSAGTTTALLSSQHAARAIGEMFEGNRVALESYCRWSAGLLKEFEAQRRRHYRYEARLQTNPFWLNRTPSIANAPESSSGKPIAPANGKELYSVTSTI